MQTLCSAYRRQQYCFVVSSIDSAQKYMSVHARGFGIWKYLPFIDTSQLHASLGRRRFLFSETVWRTSHVSSQEQIQLLAQTPRGLSSCESVVFGGGVCRGGWDSRSEKRERGLRTEEDSEYRKLDDRLWHLQRCVLGLWAMYNHGGERWLQVHDTAITLFQSEMQPSGWSLF